MTPFEFKPIAKTGGMTLALLAGDEPAGFVYTENGESNGQAIAELLSVAEKLADPLTKPTTTLWVKAFSEPVKFRLRGQRIVINIGRRKGWDGQLEDFSVENHDFFVGLFSAIRYGFNLFLAGAETPPAWLSIAVGAYNSAASRLGQKEYGHRLIR